jgi:hypothetical protein
MGVSTYRGGEGLEPIQARLATAFVNLWRREISMRPLYRLVVLLLLAVGMLATPASATHNPDRHRAMDLLFTSPNSRINSDLAFWGNHAFAGYYQNDISVGGSGSSTSRIRRPRSY